MRAALLAAAITLLAAVPAAAAPELVKIGDFSDPVHVASPPADTRVFVVERAGVVKIAGGGVFLDASARTHSISTERGLLSIAFAPDYATSGRFYVFLTSKPNGDVEVLQYLRSGADPNAADPASARAVIAPIPHSDSSHNGGQLQFGPDGGLYVSIGDNGDGANAKDPSSPFGKIHRVDPSTGAMQVWSSGLRNPWRFSFDRETTDLTIGDAGEHEWEEIDWGPAPGRGRGLDFGWDCAEGPDPMRACGEPPIVAHDHDGADAFCAIIGGYVVRDPGLPTLNGRYVYGDNCNMSLWSALPRSGADNREEPLQVSGLSSFGEDACARIYAASRSAGAVYRIQDGAPTPCSFTPHATDGTAPGLSVRIGGLRSATKRRQLRVMLSCDEPCLATISSRLRKVRRLRTRRRALAANTRTLVRVRMTKKTARRLRRALSRRGRVRALVSARARDLTGNESLVTRRAWIRAR